MTCKTFSALIAKIRHEEHTLTKIRLLQTRNDLAELVLCSSNGLSSQSRTALPSWTVNMCMILFHQLCGEPISPFSSLFTHLYAVMLLACKCTRMICPRSKSITTEYQSEQHAHKICLICNRSDTHSHLACLRWSIRGHLTPLRTAVAMVMSKKAWLKKVETCV